jgi:hypothetical protein
VNPWLRIHERWFIPARPVAANHAELRLLEWGLLVVMAPYVSPSFDLGKERRCFLAVTAVTRRARTSLEGGFGHQVQRAEQEPGVHGNCEARIVNCCQIEGAFGNFYWPAR